MKKVTGILIALLAMMIVIPANAQITEETYTLPKSQLTTEQIKAFEQAELQNKLEHYGNWVGVGGEIGTAINEGLNSVVDVADKFGNTDVGKFTMYLIAWKVVGKDIIRILLGLVFALVLTIFMFKSARKSFSPHKIMIENPGFLKYPKKYEVVNKMNENEGNYWEYAIWYKVLYAVILMIGYGITYAIMF